MTMPVSEAVSLMERRLTAWLDNPESEKDQLIRWLEGYDLPGEYDHEGAYLWLLRGLPTGRDRAACKRTLALQLGKLIEEQPDVYPQGREPGRLLYNLLSLCASLDRPDELADPLDGVLRRGRLEGRWEYGDLRRALLRGLIANQVDTRHHGRWQAMLEGFPDPFLGGTTVEGYQGVLRCPTVGRGKPDLEAVGGGLKRLAESLPISPDRGMQFEDVLAQTRRVYPHEDWDYLLILAGTKHDWPEWAAQRLPLVAKAPPMGGPGVPYILPWPIAEAVKEAMNARNGISYLHNLAQRVVLTGEAIELVPREAKKFDDRRRGVLDMADTQSAAMMAELLVPAELAWWTKGPSASGLAAAARDLRKNMLEVDGVPFKADALPSSA